MTKKQALSILRPFGNTYKALKQAYREACKIHHPDFGGSTEMMQLVNAAYEVLNNSEWSIDEQTEANETVSLTETIKDMLNKAAYPGLKAELVGTWLWITGNTYKYKKQLKEAGFRFSHGKCAWYYHEDTGYRRYHKKSYDLDDIRSKYGSKDLNTAKPQTLGAN